MGYVILYIHNTITKLSSMDDINNHPFIYLKGFSLGGGTYCSPGNNHSATRSRTATLL